MTPVVNLVELHCSFKLLHLKSFLTRATICVQMRDYGDIVSEKYTN